MAALALLDKLKRTSNQILQRNSTTAYIFIRNGKYLALGFVKSASRLAGLVVCLIQNFTGSCNKLTQKHFFFDNAGIINHVCRRRHRIENLCNILNSAGFFEPVALHKLIAQQHGIYPPECRCIGHAFPDTAGFFIKPNQSIEYVTMLNSVKGIACQQLDNLPDTFRVDYH